MNKFNSSQLLKSFTESSSTFEVLYHTRSNFSFKSITRLCILDSSFNPPHNGHESLAYKSICYNYLERTKLKDDILQEASLVLLLSVKNADKLVPKPASFDHRINMMRLLADKIATRLNINVTIGLTKHAKFADKCTAIVDHLRSKELYDEKLKMTFLLGYDTLIRVFDSKYYVPNTIKSSLGPFMEMSELFVLTRASDPECSIEDQYSYVERIRNGYYGDIPLDWSKKIYLVDSGDEFLSISSSQIRQNVLKKDLVWKSEVCEEVSSYIERYDIYASDST